MQTRCEKIIAMILVLILILLNLSPIISYAIELEGQVTTTNNANVAFDSYYYGGIHTKILEISSTENKIYLKVSVANDGYLENATIDLSDCNFSISNDDSNYGKIESFDASSKKIILNKISAGSSVEVTVNVGFEISDTINPSILNKDNTISMSGTYITSSAKQISVSKDIILHTQWHAEPSGELTSEITKYIPYTISDKTGLLIQDKLQTSIENDSLPIKMTQIELTAPMIAGENPEKVTVIANKTTDTNGKTDGIDFTNSNYSYDKTTGKIQISVTNDADTNGDVSWIKNNTDEYLINYIYSSNVYTSIKNLDTTISTKINATYVTYDDVEYSAKKTFESIGTYNAQIGNIVDFTSDIQENEISKGYLYNNVVADENKKETIYNEDYIASIIDTDLQDTVEIVQSGDKYINGNSVELTANTYNKKVIISKVEFDKLLGSTGYIKIMSGTTEIGTIDSSTTVDSTGNLELDISSNKANTITIISTAPIIEGNLKITVEKAIDTTSPYTKEEISTLKYIKTSSDVEAEKSSGVISKNTIGDESTLSEPTSKALISISKTNLSTTEANEDIVINMELEADSIDDLLYKNPTITLTLPQYITNVTIKQSELLHSDELTISEATFSQTDKTIQVKLSGEQTKYNDSITGGISILLYTNIYVDSATQTTSSNIQMLYTNENDNYSSEAQLSNHILSTTINFIAPDENTKNSTNSDTTNIDSNTTNVSSTETTNEGLQVNIEATTGDQALADGDSVFEGQTIKYTITLVNNTGNDITNLRVVGTNTNIIYYDLKIVQGYYQNDSGGMDLNNYTKYDEMTDWTEKDFDTIEKLSSGETKTLEYQVIVKEVEGENQTTSGIIKISADTITETSINTITNKIKQGELKLKTECTYYEEDTLQGGNKIPINIVIDNISGSSLDGITIECKLSDGLSIDSSGLYINDGRDTSFDYDLVSIEDNVIKLKINTTLNKDEERQILLYANIQENKNVTNVTATTVAITANNTYISNVLEREVKQTILSIQATQTCSIPEYTTLKNNNNISYIYNIKNDGENSTSITFQDTLPYGITVNSVYLKVDDKSTDISSNAIYESEKTNIIIAENLTSGQEIEITINATVDTNLAQDCVIQNYATIQYGSKIKTTNSIIHSIDNVINENITDNKNKTISGIAWLDTDNNSSKDTKESVLSGINVIIANAENGIILQDENGENITTKTDENGKYEFDNLASGKYLIIFDYDSDEYESVEYEKEGISDETNSKVIDKSVTMDGTTKIMGVTDTLTLTSSVENINIGLKIREKFDLKLEKYITKITVKNGQGTKEYDFADKSLAKVEISDKQIANSTLLIEYKIKIVNEGNSAGYANKIVDYIPEGLKFNSEINTDWYAGEDGNVYNVSLAKTLIDAGETKELTLTLIKSKTDTAAELVENTAEISQSKSYDLLSDIDSIAGNKESNEDDISKAQLIISIKTGQTETYLLLTISGITILTAIVVFIKRKGK